MSSLPSCAIVSLSNQVLEKHITGTVLDILKFPAALSVSAALFPWQPAMFWRGSDRFSTNQLPWGVRVKSTGWSQRQSYHLLGLSLTQPTWPSKERETERWWQSHSPPPLPGMPGLYSVSLSISKSFWLSLVLPLWRLVEQMWGLWNVCDRSASERRRALAGDVTRPLAGISFLVESIPRKPSLSC